MTPLLLAAMAGNIDVVKLLVEKGPAEIDIPTRAGATPLFMAAQKGYLGIVKYLVEQGANIEAETEAGATPLVVASEKGFLYIVKYLVEEKGANINAGALGRDRATALLRARQYSQAAVAKFLEEKGAVERFS